MMNFLGKIARKIRFFTSKHGFVCDCCDGEVFGYPQKRFCDGCERKISRNNLLVCPKCGRKTRAAGVCLSCKDEVPAFEKGLSPFVYEKDCAALINRMKNGKRRLAYYFAEEMTEKLLAEYGDRMQTEKFLITAVPMTLARERERGFNQANDLADILAWELERKGFCVDLCLDVLQKRREGAPQKRMDFHERKQNVVGAYHVHKRKECRDKTIVLIDDIMTTGATGSECAARLYGAGAKEVIFLVAAALPELA